MEHFVESLLLFGGTDNEALESVLLGSGLDLSISDALTELGFVAGALELFSQIKLRTNEDARAGTCRRLDLTNPLLAGVLQRVTLHQTEANDEAVGVSISDGT